MAHRIVDAGMPLIVWARRSEALHAYTLKGARAARTVAELGAQCAHVGICVVNDADVFEICDQLIPSMRSGSRIAIHSTILPKNCAELETRCEQNGIALIDAPVSGGSPRAVVGTLTVMCGGKQDVFDASLPVFRTFGKLIIRLGEVGAGQQAKLINNAMLSANMGIAHAALKTGKALGIDRTALVELIKESSGHSTGFEVYSRLPNPAAFATGAPLLLKDMNLLKTVLPEDDGAEALRAAAEPFLKAANPS